MAVPFEVDFRYIRVVELHAGAEGLQLLDDSERGAFTHVVDVTLVSHAYNQNLRPVDRLAMIVQPARHQVDHVIGHARIDLLGQRYETRLEAMHTSFPREVVRIERNTMSPYARPRIKGHEAEGLGRRRRNHLPCVDAQSVAEPSQFVHQTDVDCAESVFEQLARFGDARGTHRMHLVDDRAVDGRGDFGAGLRHAAHDFGDVSGVEILVAGIDAFGREGQEVIYVELQAGRV